jgi:hypothetical protein
VEKSDRGGRKQIGMWMARLVSLMLLRARETRTRLQGRGRWWRWRRWRGAREGQGDDGRTVTGEDKKEPMVNEWLGL